MSVEVKKTTKRTKGGISHKYLYLGRENTSNKEMKR